MNNLRGQGKEYQHRLNDINNQADEIHKQTFNSTKRGNGTPPLHTSPERAIRNQDISLRNLYIYAIFNNITSQWHFRKFFVKFYTWYISIASLFIFFVIIDPFALIKGVQSYYPPSVKEILLGTFIANILSVLVIMINFAFESNKSIEQQFKDVGRKSDNKNK